MNRSSPAIASPIIGGSGVAIVHGQLEASIPGYRVQLFDPRLGLVPPLLRLATCDSAPIIHTHPEAGLHVAQADSSLVCTFHGYYLDAEILSLSTISQRFFYRYVLGPTVQATIRRSTYVTAVSHFIADLLHERHAPGRKLHIIRNGVDTALFHPNQEPRHGNSDVRILFAGNPTRKKGIEHLSALSDELPENIRMLYTLPMRSTGVSRVGTSTKLQPVPARPHARMPDLYRDVDILFFPTKREGFGLVVAEAMACGLPVVATRCSAIPELVDHGKGGFLFDVDDRGQMLHHLRKLASDPGMRREMGIYNREKILSKFSLETMIEGYRELFASINSRA